MDTPGARRGSGSNCQRINADPDPQHCFCQFFLMFFGRKHFYKDVLSSFDDGWEPAHAPGAGCRGGEQYTRSQIRAGKISLTQLLPLFYMNG